METITIDWEVLYGKIQNLNHLFILNSKKKKRAKEVGKIAIKIKQKKIWYAMKSYLLNSQFWFC